MKTLILLITIFTIFLRQNAECQNWMQWGNGAVVVSELFSDSTTNTLYAGGKFIGYSGDTIKTVAKWNGSAWDSLGNTNSDYPFFKIIKYNDTLFASGLQNQQVYKFTGIGWFLAGTNSQNWVKDLVGYQNNLYAFGLFGNAIGKLKNNLWSFIPTPTTFTDIRTAIIYKNELYAGGSWESDSGRSIVMRWDLNSWNSLGSGLETSVICEMYNGGVQDFAIYRDELYVGGCFFKTSGGVNPDNCIGRWDGNNWNNVGGGLNGTVYHFVVYKDELYACGEFTKAGGIPADGIAKWDGIKWCSLGSNFSGDIYDMIVYNNELIISGSFTQIDGYPINHIAKWIGGNFVDTCGNSSGIEETSSIVKDFNVYPNPTNGNVTLEINLDKPENINISIYNTIGERIYFENVNNVFGSFYKNIDISGLSKGIYLININAADLFICKKIIKR